MARVARREKTVVREIRVGVGVAMQMWALDENVRRGVY